MELTDVPRRIYGRARRALSAARRADAQSLKQIARLTSSMARDKLRGSRIIIVFVEELGFIQFLLPVVEELKRRSGSSLSWYLATEHSAHPDQLAVFGVKRDRQFHP